MEYFREELFPCVSLTAVQTDKFKTGCMTAYLLTQLHRETAAENAVLAAWSAEDVDAYLRLTERYLVDLREKTKDLHRE